MKRWIPLAIIAVGFAAIVALVFSYFQQSQTSEIQIEIGQITSIEGQVEYRLPRGLGFERATAPRPLFSQQMIVTQKSSAAVLTLKGGAKLRLGEDTRFIAEVDPSRSRNADATVGTLLEGTAQLEARGSSGSFRVLREGRDITETLSSPVASAPSISPGSADPKAAAEDDSLVISATTPDESAPTPAPTAAPADDKGASGEVLTNEDILRRLRQQTGFFQRCYLGFIHRTQQQPGGLSGGKIITTFKVQPSGRVTEAGVVRSDFTDTILHKCVTEVLERTQFKAFRGATVPVLEFPITLK